MEINYKIKKLGELKTNRTDSIYTLYKNLKTHHNIYIMKDVQGLFDKLLNGDFEEEFDGIYKSCFDMIFIDNEYEEVHYDYVPPYHIPSI